MRFLAEGLVTVVTRCVLVTIALGALAQPALARTFLYCPATQLVITSTSGGDRSSRSEIDLRFVLMTMQRLSALLMDELWRSLGSTAIGSAQIAMTFFMNTIVKAER